MCLGWVHLENVSCKWKRGRGINTKRTARADSTDLSVLSVLFVLGTTTSQVQEKLGACSHVLQRSD